MPSPVRAHRDSQSAGNESSVAARPEQAKRRWFNGLTGMFGSKAPQPQAGEPAGNALLAFPSETSPRPVPVAPSSPPPASAAADASLPSAPAARTAADPQAPRALRGAITAIAIIVLLAGVAVAIVALRGIPLRAFGLLQPQPGSLTIQTRPDASEVLVDGERRGVTPITLSLAPGGHVITVRSGGDERVVPLTIAAGSDVTQHFEMRIPEPVALFGRVSVATDPPGAHVAVDGRQRGISPVTVTDLTAEEHTVTVTNDNGSAERKVAVTAGGTSSVMFSLAKAAGPIGGWLTIAGPFDVEVTENGDILGSSGANKIMMAAGRHDIVLANRAIGFQETRRIEVTAGKTTALRLDPPRVAISVNARPWAEILLDGANVGETPIANLLVTVGSHELVFRHPQLAERRQTIVVTAKGPNRIAADLTK